jgi:hypothetical protein
MSEGRRVEVRESIGGGGEEVEEEEEEEGRNASVKECLRLQNDEINI